VLAANNFFLMVLATMGYKFGHAILNRLREDGDFLVSFLFLLFFNFFSFDNKWAWTRGCERRQEMEIFSITRYWKGPRVPVHNQQPTKCLGVCSTLPQENRRHGIHTVGLIFTTNGNMLLIIRLCCKLRKNYRELWKSAKLRTLNKLIILHIKTNILNNMNS
jgi:hypothetical protein